MKTFVLPLSEIQCGFSFCLIVRGRRTTNNNSRLSITTQWFLKNPSQFGVTVWNMGFVSFCKSCNDISKSRKGFVDVFSLVQKCSLKIIYIIQTFLEIFSNGGMKKKRHILGASNILWSPKYKYKHVGGTFFVY